MSKEPGISGRGSASEDYIRLGMLLQKKRSSVKTQAVEAVLKTNLPLEEKIHRIIQIDEEEPEKKPAREQPPMVQASKSDQPEELPPTSTESLAAQRNALRNQAKVKALILRTGFFSFLFGEYRKIRDFGHESMTLIPRFPFHFKTDETFRKRLLFRIETPLKRIEAVLPGMLDQAWLYLAKRDYNILALVVRLCRWLGGFDWNQRLELDGAFLGRFREGERFFLVFHAKPDHLERVLYALDHLSGKGGNDPKPISELSTAIKTVLGNTGAHPSLADMIRAANMNVTRRFLDLEDLIQPNLGQLVSSADFDATEPVRQKIQAFLTDLLEKTQNICNRRDELVRYTVLIRTDHDGSPDYQPFFAFVSDPKQGEQDNALLSALRFHVQFYKLLSPLIDGQLRLERAGRIHLFHPSLFGNELDRMGLAARRLEKLAFSFNSFTFGRFDELRTHSRQPVTAESDVLSGLDELFGYAGIIARKLASVIHASAVSGMEADLELPLASDRKPVPIMLRDDIVLETQGIEGLPLLEALSKISGICFAAALRYMEPTVRSLQDEATRYAAELAGYKALFERIGPEPLFEYVCSRYRL